MYTVRYFIIFLLLTSWIRASGDIVCIVPEAIHGKVVSILKKPVAYNHKKIIVKTYKMTENAIRGLANGKSKFAIIRSDILYRMENNALYQDTNVSRDYIVLSRLPYNAKLYLVRPGVYHDMDIEALRGKMVSIGKINESNGYLLKTLMGHSDAYRVNFTSETLKNSLKKMDLNELDGFFGFLDESIENNNYHFQSHFTDKEIEAINKDQLYLTKFNSVFVPYFIIASKHASDEEIETLLYRLEERGFLVPITSERYGRADLYLPHHLEQIKLALEERYKHEAEDYEKIYTPHIISNRCMTYHYGFLKLLRKKPSLKKRLAHRIRKGDHKMAKAVFYRLENILIGLDERKYECDLKYLDIQKKLFSDLSKQL